MNTIIAATDFSPVATNAVNYAVRMAKETGSSIILFHVFELPVVYTDVPVSIPDENELRKNAEDALQELKQNLMNISAGEVKIYTQAEMGNPVTELEAYCKKIDPLAVVMGALGKSAVEHVLFGSTTLAAIKRLRWPVIVVPVGVMFRPIKKIGMACDFRKVVETLPEKAIENLLDNFKAEMHILNVDHNHKHFTADTPAESLMVQTMFQKYNPQYHFIEDEDIEKGINRFAEENNLDLIIAVPKKHIFPATVFHSSSTRKLVFRSHIPVACVHEEEAG